MYPGYSVDFPLGLPRYPLDLPHLDIPWFSFGSLWDVFLSFIGEDTRHTITHSLYKSFDEQGIRAFRDDEDGGRYGSESESDRRHL